MTTTQVTLTEVEACLAAGTSGRLAFSPALALRYADTVETVRLKTMKKGLMPILVLYNICILNDWFMAPDTFWLSAGLHAFVVSPLMVIASFFYSKSLPRSVRNILAGSISVAMVAQIMFVYVMNDGPAIDHFQYLAIVVVMYVNINQRLGYTFAVVLTCVLTAEHFIGLSFGSSPAYVKVAGVSLMSTVAWTTLLANKRFEGGSRYNFLVNLREQFRREAAEMAASRDALTGLWNRAHFTKTADMLWVNEARRGENVAIVMIDVDHFKLFNDRYGHPEGDKCLVGVSAAIKAMLTRGDDLVVRFGGEEFLVLLHDCDLHGAVVMASTLRSAIETLKIPHDAVGAGRLVTASIGVMAGPISGTNVTELIEGADAALYVAKKLGRNQVWPKLPCTAGQMPDEAEIPAVSLAS